MTQVITTVRHALRLLRVIDAETVPEAQQFNDARDALNRMMTTWEVDNLPLGWQNVTLPTDVLPTDPALDEAIGYNLAVKLQPEYGVALSPAVIAGASSGLATVRAYVMMSRLYLTESPDLPSGQGQGNIGGWQAGLSG